MNDALAAIELGRRVDLTREADIIHGPVEVRPTACEVVFQGRRVRLQPRVMQVLVALARFSGEPVSRETLARICWGDVAVGEDALNRCIQRLRRLSEHDVEQAFAIETIPRIGYRLRWGTLPNPDIDPAPVTEVGPLDPIPKAGARRAGPARVWLIAAAVLLAGVAAMAIVLLLSGPRRWTIDRSEPIASTPLLERHPAISRDGTMIAYSAGADVGGRRIYIKRLAGGEPAQLTDDGFDDVSPVWSREGGRVAYVASRSGEPCRIMLINITGGLPRQIARCLTDTSTHLTWSADGALLYFSDAPAPNHADQIVRVDLASGRRLAVSHPPPGTDDIEPSLSPDGRWLAFSRTEGEKATRTMIEDLRTGRESVVAALGPDADAPAWAEDSRSIFVANVSPKEATIWSYPINGGPPTRLIGMPSVVIGRLAMGPGGLLAAEITSGRSNLARPPEPGESGPVIVDPANSGTWGPAWSAKGDLAVASVRSGVAGIWIKHPDRPAHLLLSVTDMTGAGLAWSPDGAALAFGVVEGDTSIRVVGAEGETIASIPVTGLEAGAPVFSADGRAVIFPARDIGGWRIWRGDLDHAGRPYPISGYGWRTARQAPDGQLLGVRTDRPGIWRISASPSLVAPGFSGVTPESWTVLGHRIIYGDAQSGRTPRLMEVPLGGGAARSYADLPQANPDLEFALDPRTGKPVYVVDVSFDTDILLFHLRRQ